MAQDSHSLHQLLERLLDLTTTDAERQNVDELIRRLERRAFRIVVAGEAKRGKSTVINALLERPVLPTGVVPLTAVTTTVVFGDQPKVDVRFRDGSSRVVPVAEIEKYVTENGNPNNTRDVTEVIVAVPADLLAAGAELVDTPGTGSVHRHNTEAALAAYQRMDAAIFVLTADPPISDSERELVQTVSDSAVTTWFLLNKVDRLGPDEVSTAVDFTRQVLEELVAHHVEVWPVSALRSAGDGRPPSAVDRFDEFAAAFRGYVCSGSAHDLDRSLTARATRIAQGIKDRDEASLAAACLADQSQASALITFEACLREVDEGRRATSTHLDSAIRMLISETDEAAGELLGRAQGALEIQLREFLRTTDRAPKDAESAAIELATTYIRSEVEAWRAAWRQRLDSRLATAEAELGARLDRQIATVRTAASDLFGVTLSTYAVEQLLIGADRFTFQFQPHPGQYDTMAATLRRVLPTRLTRRWVARYVLTRASALLDQQVGRARSHFQRALSETGREIQAALDQQYEEGAGALVAAIEAGTKLRHASQSEVNARLDVLRERGGAARELLCALRPRAD